VKRLYAAYVTWRIQRVDIAELRAMSGRQLNDIGLTRANIADAVRTGACRLGQAERRPNT
jgi:uncharacterized protein YjiS (DUF1127 family)